MKKDYIRKYFKKRNYKITECFSGAIIIKQPFNGFTKQFESLNAAFKYYFTEKY